MKHSQKDWIFTKDEWSIITSNWVQTWPKHSVETFLTKPPAYYSKTLLDKCDIKIPPAPYAEILPSLGIRRAAIVKRDDKYFVSRNNRNCYFVVFCVSIKNYNIISNSRHRVKSGQIYIIPPNKQIDTSANSVNAIWFEIDNSPYWKNILGTSIIIKDSKKIGDIAHLTKMYLEEIHSQSPDFETLEIIAKLLIKTISKEFEESNDTSKQTIISNLLDEISKSPAKRWTLIGVAKRAKMSKDTLNNEFVKLCGKTFSKKLLETRMFAALKLIESGKTLEETSQKVGYFDSHSLSLAFKKFFGVKPSSIKKHS